MSEGRARVDLMHARIVYTLHSKARMTEIRAFRDYHQSKVRLECLAITFATTA